MTTRSTATHTPGPWTTFRAPHGQMQIRDEAREIVIAALPDRGTAHPNAHLIAAAPELLAALRNVLVDTCCLDLAGLSKWRDDMRAAHALLDRIDGAA